MALAHPIHAMDRLHCGLGAGNVSTIGLPPRPARRRCRTLCAGPCFTSVSSQWIRRRRVGSPPTASSRANRWRKLHHSRHHPRAATLSKHYRHRGKCRNTARSNFFFFALASWSRNSPIIASRSAMTPLWRCRAAHAGRLRRRLYLGQRLGRRAHSPHAGPTHGAGNSSLALYLPAAVSDQILGWLANEPNKSSSFPPCLRSPSPRRVPSVSVFVRTFR